MNSITRNVELIIESKGLKKKSVAMRAGYTKQQFSNLINGRKTIKPEDIVKIAMALEVTPNDLFGFSNKSA